MKYIDKIIGFLQWLILTPGWKSTATLIVLLLIMLGSGWAFVYDKWIDNDAKSLQGDKVEIEKTKPDDMTWDEYVKDRKMYELDQFASGIDEKDFKPTSENKLSNPSKGTE